MGKRALYESLINKYYELKGEQEPLVTIPVTESKIVEETKKNTTDSILDKIQNEQDYGLLGDLGQAITLDNPYTKGEKQMPIPQATEPRVSNEPVGKEMRDDIISAFMDRIRFTFSKSND